MHPGRALSSHNLPLTSITSTSSFRDVCAISRPSGRKPLDVTQPRPARRARNLQLSHQVQLLPSFQCVLLLTSRYSNAIHDAMSNQAKQSGARDKATGVAYIVSKVPVLKGKYELKEPVTGSFVKVCTAHEICRANWISCMSLAKGCPSPYVGE